MLCSRVLFQRMLSARIRSSLVSISAVLVSTTLLFASQASAAESAVAAPSANQAAPTDDGTRDKYWVFPKGELFEPLLADPQWPRFSAEYQWRSGTEDFEQVANVSFGETFAFVRSPQYDWGEWEVGLQASLDAIFDFTAQSTDLSNEDYFVGFTASLLTQGVTTQLRIYHISSHLGDEYLLAVGGDREDVSFEVIDVLVSYEPRKWLRLYGGLGVFVTPSPDFDPVLTEFGLELTSPRSFLGGYWTPIAGMDLQVRQENDWIPDVSILAGIRLAQPGNDVRRLEFFARYYNGRSPDGQFFRQKIQSGGLGLRLGF